MCSSCLRLDSVISEPLCQLSVSYRLASVVARPSLWLIVSKRLQQVFVVIRSSPLAVEHLSNVSRVVQWIAAALPVPHQTAAVPRASPLRASRRQRSLQSPIKSQLSCARSLSVGGIRSITLNGCACVLCKPCGLRCQSFEQLRLCMTQALYGFRGQLAPQFRHNRAIHDGFCQLSMPEIAFAPTLKTALVHDRRQRCV